MAGDADDKSIENATKHIRRGITLFKRGKSRFWYARVYDARENRIRTKSTQTTIEREARGVAIAFANEIADAAETSKRKQGISALREVRKGFAIFQKDSSPYWYARIWIPSQKKYLIRSTKEKSRVEALASAEEILQSLNENQLSVKVPRSRSFSKYADELIKEQRRIAGEKRNPRFSRDDEKLILRKGDGIWEFFGERDIGSVSTADIRDYLNFLDDAREKPLALSTKNKHAIVIRKILKLAYDAREIDNVPPSPKIGTKDSPRASFTDAEYKLLLKTIREEAGRGVSVRGVPLTRELYYFVLFLVHTWMRPIESEIFALKHKDIEVRNEPNSLVLHIYGKTGYRQGSSTKFGVKFYEHMREKIHPTQRADDDYVFFPDYKNRSTALRNVNRQFNHILDVAGLKMTRDGQPRSPYSLRHYGLSLRLRRSQGEVNTFLLAKSAGTSVDQLERFYLRFMEMTPEQVRNLQSMGKS